MMNGMHPPKYGLLVLPVLVFFLLGSFLSTPMCFAEKSVASGQTQNGNFNHNETTEKTIARLKDSLINARQALQGSQAVLESTPPEQLGATPEEVQQKMQLLLERVVIYEQHIARYRALAESRRANHDLTVKIEGWQGFQDPPPYPVSLVDELRDAIETEKLAIAKDETQQALVLASREEIRQKLEDSEQRLRKANEALERPAKGDNGLRLNWLRELAQLENEVARAGMLATKTQLEAIEESIAFHQKNITFLERKLHIAAADAPFTKEELDEKLTAIDRKMKTLEHEQARASRADSQNQLMLDKARQKLQKARAGLLLEGVDELKANNEIRALQDVVDTRKAWADTSAQMVNMYKIEALALKGETLLWEKRFRLSAIRDDTTLRKAVKELDKNIERINEYQSVVASNLELAQSLIFKEQQRLAGGGLSGSEQVQARERLEAYQKREQFFTKKLANIKDLGKLARRIRDEVVDRREHITLGERLRSIFGNVDDVARAFWNYELFSVEDTVVVDGEQVTGRRPVTVNKVVVALLILTIGLWLSSRLKHGVGRLAERLFSIDAGAAGLVRKLFQVLAIVCLVVFALTIVKIPLTIFAFMGGALAIGVGFGAQNLINNFISGIILLFERPIKAGDIVEVDATQGRVINIGARCSQVRRFDGIDILVPNSEFLQKSVVNWTLSDQLIRLTVRVGVAYDSSTREVARIITKSLEEHGKILQEPEPTVFFESFGDSALVFKVNFWVEVDEKRQYRIVESDFRHMLIKRFREAGITIAFPQQDVHMDSIGPIKVQLVQEPAGPEKQEMHP